MDVFSSALKNPLPPTRRKFDLQIMEGRESNTSPEHEAKIEPIPAYTAHYAKVPQLPSPYMTEQPNQDNKKKNSRRRHRNSHLGCGICKKRRIKCDEHLPQCFNCVKGRLHCAYLHLDAPARNALRLAQYNQNLRDERNEESLPKNTEETAHYSGNSAYQPPLYPNPSTDPLLVYSTHNWAASNGGDAKYGQELPRQSVTANAANAALSQSMPSPVLVPPHMTQSMYVPVVQLQPVNPGMPYTQLPMQMVAGQQQQQQLVYASADQMQLSSQGLMQMRPSPAMHPLLVMYLPAQTHEPMNPYDHYAGGAYMAPMQRHYGPPKQMTYTNGTRYLQDSYMPEVVVSTPPAGILSPPSKPHRIAARHPTRPSVITPVVFPNSASAPSVLSRNPFDANSSSANRSRVLDLPSVDLALNPTSHGASPLLPSITDPDLIRNGTGNPKDTPVKLAPIQHKGDDSKCTPSEPDTERISSIKMLLS